MPRSSDTLSVTPKSGDNGSHDGKSESASDAPTSKNCVGPASVSKGPWRTPRTVKELAGQASIVGTMLLNDQMPLETAKAYSAIVRSTAQLISAEVARARARREEPDLSL